MARKPRMAGLQIALLISFLAFACTAAVANAAPQGPWQLPANNLSENGLDASGPQIAISPDGSAHVIWRQENATLGIWTASRIPGGAFGAPQPVALSNDSVDYPQIAIADDGTAIAVWKRQISGDYVIQAAVRPPGGSFGAPDSLSAVDHQADWPQIAIAPDGTATVVWQVIVDGDRIIQAATRPPGGEFGPSEDLSAPTSSGGGQQIAVAPDGTAIAIWIADSVVETATRPPGGTFGAPVPLSNPFRDSSNPQIAFAPDGSATAVWSQKSSGSGIPSIHSATRPPGGTFGAPTELSEGGSTANRPQIAIGSDGTATAIWFRYNESSHAIVQASTRPPGGDFSSPVDLSEAGQNALDPQVAIAPDGTATVVWQRSDGSNDIIQAATRPPGGSFGTPINLSQPGNDAYAPQVDIAPDGVVTAVWELFGGSIRVQSASTEAPSNLLTVTRSGDGQGGITSAPAGIDCGTTCSASYPSYTKVTLTAAPAAGSTFTGWSGACSGTAPTCEVTMLEAETVNATFALKPQPPAGNRPNCKRGTLKLGKFRAIRRNGTGLIRVRTGSAGRLILQGSKRSRKAVKRLKRRGATSLRIKAKGRAQQQLRRRGKTTVKVRIVFRPAIQGCRAKSKTKKVRLVKASAHTPRKRAR